MLFITSFVCSYILDILIKFFTKDDIKDDIKGDIKDQEVNKNKIVDKDINVKSIYKKQIIRKQIKKINNLDNLDTLDTIDTINTINTLEPPCTVHILDNKDFYYEYKGYRYLSNFPKKWLETIDKYDNLGLDCANCLYYCCLKKEGYLPLFLGFCDGCFMHFIIKNTCDGKDKCEYCTSSSDCYYCDTCTTNVINFSTDITNTLYYHKDNKKILTNLILKLNNEYGNLHVE